MMNLENGRLKICSMTEACWDERFFGLQSQPAQKEKISARDIRQRLVSWFLKIISEGDKQKALQFHADSTEYLTAHIQGLNNLAEQFQAISPGFALEFCDEAFQLGVGLKWLHHIKEKRLEQSQ